MVFGVFIHFSLPQTCGLLKRHTRFRTTRTCFTAEGQRKVWRGCWGLWNCLKQYEFWTSLAYVFKSLQINISTENVWNWNAGTVSLKINLFLFVSRLEAANLTEALNANRVNVKLAIVLKVPWKQIRKSHFPWYINLPISIYLHYPPPRLSCYSCTIYKGE